VLAAGRLWDEAKGLTTLAAAALDCAWPVMVAGPTKMPGSEEVVHVHGVELLGPLSSRSLANYMARAAIYALPARYEPFGLSVLEAALSGCALVLGDIPSLREVWGDTAVYVDPADARALADAINTVAHDPATFAAASRARALTLTPTRMGSLYNALYQALTSATEEACAS
jgi:glycosyltransferase involved in cell wall biosynthesis